MVPRQGGSSNHSKETEIEIVSSLRLLWTTLIPTWLQHKKAMYWSLWCSLESLLCWTGVAEGLRSWWFQACHALFHSHQKKCTFVCWSTVGSYWVYTQYRLSIPRSMKISQILRNLLSGIQVGFANRCRLGAIVVASRGICFQKVLVCLSCLRHAVAGWALERFFVIPRWPEYLGMRQIHGMRFGACMAVPQKPMFPWRSARSG